MAMRLIILALQFLFSSSPAGVLPRPSLDEILQRKADYCRKLEEATLNYVCLEEITEKINRSKDIKLNQGASLDIVTDGVWTRSGAAIPASRVKRTFLYDFQFVRRGSGVKETRTLLEENGKKKREENASLKTSNFVYRNALLGPVAIFGKRWRELYDYRLTGEAKFGDRPCVIVDVSPKAPHPDIRFLFGRAYVDESTLDILKIE